MFDTTITPAVARIAENLASLDAVSLATVTETAELPMSDWLTFGDKPSRFLIAGVVDADAAQVLHSIHTRYNSGASLAERLVFLMVMSEGLPRMLAAERG